MDSEVSMWLLKVQVMSQDQESSATRTWSVALCVLFALVQIRFAGEILGGQFSESLDASEGVFYGVPHWLIYQSRVLGPYAVHLLGKLLGSKGLGYLIWMLACFTAAGLLFLQALSLEFRGAYKYLGFLIFQLLIAVSMNKLWLYPWDLLSLVLFCGFLLLVLRKAPNWQFVALFVVALFNRESALFMALWLMIEPLCDWYRAKLDGEGGPIRLDVKRMALGLTLLVGGVVVIGLLRQYLLVKESGPELFNLPDMAGKAIHFKVGVNVRFLLQTLTLSAAEFDFVLPWLYGLAFAVLWMSASLRQSRLMGMALVHGLMLVAIFAVAAIPETRVFFELVPFLALASLHVLRDQWLAPAHERGDQSV
jgi:hypothetical protein